MVNATRRAKAGIDDAEDGVTALAAKAARTAKDAVDGAQKGGAKLRAAAASARDAAGEKLEEMGDSLHETGERLKQSAQRAGGRDDLRALQDSISAAVTSGFSAATDALREGRVAGVAADLRDAARRNPAPFILGAAVAGFVVGRFLLSARDDREHQRRRGRS